MLKRTKIGDVEVEYDANATRAKYATVAGTIDNCTCGSCENYRGTRDAVYPSKFLALLSELGIDPKKETELTHYADDDSDRTYGHPAHGHFAFVGRIVGTPLGIGHETKTPFDFWIGLGVHPTTSATYGENDSMVDLCFYVADIPQAMPQAET